MILDTVAVSGLLDGDAALGELLRGIPKLKIPAVVLGEYRYGLESSRHRARLEPMLSALQEASEVLVVDADTAMPYAQIKERLRKLGQPVPENDLWIAALAIQHRLAVISRDTDFDRIPGVKRIGW